MTIAQQLKIKEFPLEIKDSKGKIIYYEDSDGYWHKFEYDSKGDLIYYENSEGTIIDARPKSHKTELTLLEIFETKQAFNKWLKELTETEKLLILEMMDEARKLGYESCGSLN